MKLLTIVFVGVIAVAAVTVATLLSLYGGDVHTSITKLTADTSAYVSYSESTEDNSLSQTNSAPNPSDRGSTGLASSSYVMANRYSGQQGAGVRSLGSLQCLLGSYNLPVKIVEPFFLGNFKSDFPQDSTSTPLKFGDLFDLQHFNKLSQQEAEPPLAPWDDFVENAPRNVIFIDGNSPKKSDERFKLLGDVKSGVGIENLDMVTSNKQHCFSTKYTKNQQLSKLGFCVVRIAQITLPNNDQMVTDDSLYKYLYGDWDPRHVTLVFKKWLRQTWIQSPSTLDIFNCSNLDWNRIQHRLLPSQKLLKDSQFYTKHYLHSSNQATVMVRSEKVLLQFNKGLSIEEKIIFFKSCLQDAISKAYKGTNDTTADHAIYLTLDVSTYGSQSASGYLGTGLYNQTYEFMKNMITKLYGNKMSLRDWEDSFIKASGGVDSAAYIAALQRTIASQTDCLILVGGGHFQFLALKEYLRLHPNPEDQCIHTVCVIERLAATLRH